MDKLKEYGKIGIVTHLSLSWSLFAGAYLLIHNSTQTDKIINFFRLQIKVSKGVSSFVIAAVIYKVTMPVRIALTLATVPLVIKTFGLEVAPLRTTRNDRDVLDW